jgi:hypothetical protein
MKIIDVENKFISFETAKLLDEKGIRLDKFKYLYTKDIGNKMICPMIEDKIMENTIPAYKYKDLSTILNIYQIIAESETINDVNSKIKEKIKNYDSRTKNSTANINR